MKKSDIFIDQIGDRGGWGYGMNSVESLSMGICTMTEINDSYNSFIPDHPFIAVTKDTLEDAIKKNKHKNIKAFINVHLMGQCENLEKLYLIIQ